MLIVWEGDPTERERLVPRLRSFLGCAVLRGAASTTLATDGESPPVRHPLYELETSLYFGLRYRPGAGRHVLLDGWHLERPTLDPVSRWHVELLLESLGALLVYVGADRDAHPPPTRLPYLVLAPPAADHDEGWAELVRVKADARNVERLHQDLAPFASYVGPRWPSLLLLGEARNLPEPVWRRVRGPAFLPLPATSGRYLLDALLRRVDPVRERLGVANAVDGDDPRALWETLGKPPTVALGRAAAHAASWARPVDHPQYVRRFHHAAQLAYADWILRGIRPAWRLERGTDDDATPQGRHDGEPPGRRPGAPSRPRPARPA